MWGLSGEVKKQRGLPKNSYSQILYQFDAKSSYAKLQHMIILIVLLAVF